MENKAEVKNGPEGPQNQIEGQPSLGYSQAAIYAAELDAEGLQRIKAYLNNIPKLHSGLFDRVLLSAQKASRAEAVKAKCIDCMGFENVANRVRECSAVTCPLYHFRPYQDKSEAEAENGN